MLERVVSATRAWRWVFVVFAAALFVGTHWPNLKVDVPMVERPDLLVHMCVFGAWFVFLWLSALVGRPVSWMTVLKCAIVAVAYAAVDESMQAIPWVRRHAAWDDFGANCLGIGVAASVAWMVVWVIERGRRA